MPQSVYVGAPMMWPIDVGRGRLESPITDLGLRPSAVKAYRDRCGTVGLQVRSAGHIRGGVAAGSCLFVPAAPEVSDGSDPDAANESGGGEGHEHRVEHPGG